MNKSSFVITQKEWLMVQSQIDKYDSLGIKIKTWAITLWLAAIGWSLTSKNNELVLLTILVLLCFWIMDSVNKSFRETYKKRRSEIKRALQQYFKKETWPKDFLAPKSMEIIKWKSLKVAFQIHVGLLYACLITASLIFFFLVK